MPVNTAGGGGPDKSYNSESMRRNLLSDVQASTRIGTKEVEEVEDEEGGGTGIVVACLLGSSAGCEMRFDQQFLGDPRMHATRTRGNRNDAATRTCLQQYKQSVVLRTSKQTTMIRSHSFIRSFVMVKRKLGMYTFLEHSRPLRQTTTIILSMLCRAGCTRSVSNFKPTTS